MPAFSAEYAFAVGRGPTIGVEELPPEFRERQQSPVPRVARTTGAAGTDEAQRVIDALDEAAGDIELAAASLQVSRTTFWRMRKRAGV